MINQWAAFTVLAICRDFENEIAFFLCINEIFAILVPFVNIKRKRVVQYMLITFNLIKG